LAVKRPMAPGWQGVAGPLPGPSKAALR